MIKQEIGGLENRRADIHTAGKREKKGTKKHRGQMTGWQRSSKVHKSTVSIVMAWPGFCFPNAQTVLK